MLQYIYFVKCPNCEDEPFDFFDEAKEFACSCLSKKPIITQVEVDRNDFGECVNSFDLGTIWSWEDVMKETEAEPAVSIFTKGDFAKYNPDCDEEFDGLDNSVDLEVEETLKEPASKAELEKAFNDAGYATVRKPIPEGMTIEQLVEEMEENEDTVECVVCEELFPKEDCFHKDDIGWLCSDCEDTVVKCTWCEDLFDKSQCRYEVDLGWLCSRCEMAIKSRGETLTFRENNFLDEAKVLKETLNPREWVAFDYDELEIEATYGRQDPDDGSYPSVKHKDSYTYWKRAEDVAEDLWDRFITEEDAKGIPGGLEALEDEAAWVEFLSNHFDSLVEKYYEEFLEYYEEDAKAEFEQEFDYDDYVDGVRSDMAYDEYRDSLYEKLEEADEYRKHLTMCPECGDSAFDAGTGFCIGCGFN